MTSMELAIVSQPSLSTPNYKSMYEYKQLDRFDSIDWRVVTTTQLLLGDHTNSMEGENWKVVGTLHNTVVEFEQDESYGKRRRLCKLLLITIGFQ
jgi:hypothetical protein